MDRPYFIPWRGDNYGTSTPRLMVLGESHNGAGECAYSAFTEYVVRRFGLERRDRFMTMVAKLVGLADPSAYLTDAARAAFWNSVAFYNYVQRLLPAVRVAPGVDDWREGAGALKWVVVQQRPQVVIALGFRLWQRLSALDAPEESEFGFPTRSLRPPICAARGHHPCFV